MLLMVCLLGVDLMSKVEMESKVYTRYSPTKSNRLQNVKKNAVMIHNSASVKGSKHVRHELSKSLGGIMVHKWGDIKFDDKLKGMIGELADYVVDCLFKGWADSHENFLTECYDETGRRIDLVRLRGDVRFEWETDHSVDKGKEHNDDTTVTIYV